MSVNSYIRKCILDAMKSEGREVPKEGVDYYYWYAVIDGSVLYEIYTPYDRVNRKVEYRLRGNLHRNFPSFKDYHDTGLDICLLPGDSIIDVCRHVRTFRVDCGDEGDRWYQVINRDVALEKGKVFWDSTLEEILCKICHNIDLNKANEDPVYYLQCFTEAFGHPITTVRLKQVWIDTFGQSSEDMYDVLNFSRNVSVVS